MLEVKQRTERLVDIGSAFREIKSELRAESRQARCNIAVTTQKLGDARSLKILVISLKNNCSRRNFQQRQAAKLGLDIEFVDAVSADELSPQKIQSYANQWTRPIRGQDVACTLSHWKVWEMVAAQKEKVCVLEDDVVLSENIRSVLEHIDALENSWDYIYDLEYALRQHTLGKRPVWWDDKLKISASIIYKNKRGAAAYILGPRAAQRLRAEATQYWMMEAFLWTRRWATLVQIEPCQVVQLDVFDSNASFPSNGGPSIAREIFRNQSWLEAKLVRLKVSLNEAMQALSGALFGDRRPLDVNRSDFQIPKKFIQMNE